MRRNLVTALPRCRRAAPMAAYDRLTPELRRWLAQAALPWSPQSVARLWSRALRETGGDRRQARERLDRAEARMLAQDAARIWGVTHPQVVTRQAGDAP